MREHDYYLRAVDRAFSWAHRFAQNRLEHDPASALKVVRTGLNGKPLYDLELAAEEVARVSLEEDIPGIRVLGEEELANTDLDLSGQPGIFLLLDIIDGSELALTGLGNWCSAAVFVEPRAARSRGRIFGTCVGVPGVGTYGAFREGPGPVLFSAGGTLEIRDAPRLSTTTRLANAAIAFYGQKASRLRPLLDSGVLQRLLEQASRTPDNNFRVYNLGGNPMISKMLSAHRALDALFEVTGQWPIDVLPAAYIAVSAGAVLKDLSGKKIDLEDVVLKPSRTNSRVKYVMASTDALCDEIIVALSAKPLRNQLEM